MNTRLDELKGTVRINGFRPGKVPVGHLKRIYGRSVMAEAIEAAVRDANAKIVAENNLRLAMEPQVKLPTEEAAINAVVEGKADLDYSVAMEILPKIELARFKDIKLERLDRRGRRTPRSTTRSRPSPRRTGRFCPRPRAPRRPTATRSRSTSPARSTACRSRAAPARISPS